MSKLKSGGIPGIAKWSQSAGGTFAAEDKHGYSFSVTTGPRVGNWGGFIRYDISPVSHSNGRHRGYSLSAYDNGRYVNLGMHRSPQAAVTAARIAETARKGT